MLESLSAIFRTARVSPFGVYVSKGQDITLPEHDPIFKNAVRGMSVLEQYRHTPEYPAPKAGFLTVKDLESVASLCPDGTLTKKQAAAVYGYLAATWIRQKVMDKRLAVNAALLFVSLFLLNSFGEQMLRSLSKAIL